MPWRRSQPWRHVLRAGRHVWLFGTAHEMRWPWLEGYQKGFHHLSPSLWQMCTKKPQRRCVAQIVVKCARRVGNSEWGTNEAKCDRRKETLMDSCFLFSQLRSRRTMCVCLTFWQWFVKKKGKKKNISMQSEKIVKKYRNLWYHK